MFILGHLVDAKINIAFVAELITLKNKVKNIVYWRCVKSFRLIWVH